MSHTQTLSDSGRTTERRVAHSGLISPPTESTVGLVHDLGNLIQIASSAINIVARNPNINTDDMKFVIAGARTSLERAGALVRQTIGIASQRITTTEQVWVASRLAEIEDLLHSIWDKRIPVSYTHLTLPTIYSV